MELFEQIENRLLSHKLLCAQGLSLDVCACGCEYLVRIRIDTVRSSHLEAESKSFDAGQKERGEGKSEWQFPFSPSKE
jgi:hypothetical protein